MAQRRSFLSATCLIVAFAISSLCNGIPSEESNKEDGIENSNIQRPVVPNESDGPIDSPTNERNDPIEVNERLSSTDIKDQITSSVERDGRSNPIPLNGRNGPLELTRQSGPLEINPRGNPTHLNERLLELMQRRRPSIFDSGDYGILNRLKLPFKPFEDLPLSSFYDSAIGNTPFGTYRDDNFRGYPYRSNRNDNTNNGFFGSFPGRVFQGDAFSRQDNSRENKQLISQYGPTIQDRPFISQHGQDAGIAQKSIPQQYNFAPGKSFLPQHIPVEIRKPFTESHRDVSLDKPFTPHHGTLALDKTFTSPESNVNLDKQLISQRKDTFAVEKPVMLQQETTVIDMPLNSQQEVTVKAADSNFETPLDRSNVLPYQLKYGNPQVAKCDPNKTWKVLINRNSNEKTAQ